MDHNWLQSASNKSLQVFGKPGAYTDTDIEASVTLISECRCSCRTHCDLLAVTVVSGWLRDLAAMGSAPVPSCPSPAEPIHCTHREGTGNTPAAHGLIFDQHTERQGSGHLRSRSCQSKQDNRTSKQTTNLDKSLQCTLVCRPCLI